MNPKTEKPEQSKKFEDLTKQVAVLKWVVTALLALVTFLALVWVYNLIRASS